MQNKSVSIITIIASILIIIGFSVPSFLTDQSGTINSVVTAATAIIGAIALFFQFKKDKQINQASFMMEYSKSFYDTYNCQDLFALLDKALNNYEITEKDFDKDLKKDLVNYLIWCEGLCSLILQGLLPIKQVDALFSYRFFLITNCKFIQDTELVTYAEYYEETIKVHEMWTKYKRSKNLPIILDESNLTDRLKAEKEKKLAEEK